MENLLFKAYRGSYLYGLNTPTSDIDFIEVGIYPLEFYFSTRSFSKKRSFDKIEGELDIVQHEFLKFVSMLAKGNPNVLDFLWNESWMVKHELWDLIVEKRNMFISKRVMDACFSMARGDLKKIALIRGRPNYQEDKNHLRIINKRFYNAVLGLRKGRELLTTGHFDVHRAKDREEFLQLKLGTHVDPDGLLTEEMALFSEAEKKHSVPEKVDIAEVDKLCLEILKGHFGIS